MPDQRTAGAATQGIYILTGWCCKYVFAPFPLSKYALIAHSKYEGAYLLSRVIVQLTALISERHRMF